MKKIYICPETEVVEAEAEGVVCASINGVVGVNGPYNGEHPNGGEDLPGFGGYTGEDSPPSTAKEFDLWGDW
jgi:hypothetical protein